MERVQLCGLAADELLNKLVLPELPLGRVIDIQGKMLGYQMALLYRLATQYAGGDILEIGCYHGRSAVLLALAAPGARIVTMSPDTEHVRQARRNRGQHKIEILRRKSWDYLEQNRDEWDMIYIDGDHNHVRRDMPWFNRLRVGGLILFHDYTPPEAEALQHPYVVAAVDDLALQLGREPDVLVVDDKLIGMAGFYRGEGEQWSSTS